MTRTRSHTPLQPPSNGGCARYRCARMAAGFASMCTHRGASGHRIRKGVTPMSTLNAILDGKLQGDVQLADNSVHVERLVPRMVVFVVRAGNIHSALFNKPLVLTSGNDGEHMERSAHYRNAAVDMRSRDVTPVQQQLFTL